MNPRQPEPLPGIHHITAMTPSAADNLAFYENVLGLRLVKQTVNFDDPFTYHLYYGDAQGSPGTILTFFPWQNLPQGRPGAGMVTAVAFAVPGGSLDYWAGRLERYSVRMRSARRFGDQVLAFQDPHGLALELVSSPGKASTVHWQASPVEAAHAITGFHSATATLRSMDGIKTLLTQVLGMRQVQREGNRFRFATADAAAPGRIYDVVADADAPEGRQGAGSVHHIAFRTPDDEAQGAWQTLLRQAGVPATEVRDRHYFRSIYFRSPGGVLFEIATDPPGFTRDESLADLGGTLKLPPQYESMRARIEARLPALREASPAHRFQPAKKKRDDGATLVALHGMGGSEHDLVDLAAEVSKGAAVLSPRGRVLENGQSRFFSRLANNVFDEAEVIRRAHELADFLERAAGRYARPKHQLTALGYSNGANIAAAVLLLRPETFARAILIRPMLPLQPTSLPDLSGKQVLVLQGQRDQVIPSASTDQLTRVLEQAGAGVLRYKLEAGHELTGQDVALMADWLGDGALQGGQETVDCPKDASCSA
jgi:glyoxalase family protein